MGKRERQKLILKIISEKDIETQEELTGELAQAGVKTTQATISRDIRELRLKKKPAGTGKQKYFAPEPKDISGDKNNNESYTQVLSSGIVDITAAGNLIVVKTYSGMAMAVGAAIDSMNIEAVAGCIAGDDTIFVAVTNVVYIDKVMSELRGVGR